MGDMGIGSLVVAVVVFWVFCYLLLKKGCI